MGIEKFIKGQIIYRQGEPSDSLYFITSGEVGLFANKLGEKSKLTQFGPGRILGDLGFFTGAPRTSDAIATGDVTCTRVDYESMRTQFKSLPPWIQSMTTTLANQVRDYSLEIKPLREHDDGAAMSRLIVARSWAALTLIPHQFGEREEGEISIDWSTLRMISNLCFREISNRVLQIATSLEPHGYCSVATDSNGPTVVVLKRPKIFSEFLTYYTRAVVNNCAELTSVGPTETAVIELLANPQLRTTPIHRGQVELSLAYFTEFAKRMGHPEITATSVDLLATYGLEMTKSSIKTGVGLRFHQEEVVQRATFWRILKILRTIGA
jgi:CRP-like cAMP-binding protein